MPLVSVIVPAFNQNDFLGEAIQSVFDQTLDDFELIVVDDGSTDDTAQRASAIRDPRFRYIYQENQGLSAARNTGIRASDSTFLSFLDSDDLFEPAKLELLVGVLDDNPSAGLAAGQAVPIDTAGNPVGKLFDTPPSDDPSQLLLGNPLHVGSILLRREWQERVGFFDETLRSYEDWDMWLRLACAGCRFAWLAEPVSRYRFHREQMTRIGTQMTTATFAVLDKFFNGAQVPAACVSVRDQAYSRAHLRAAAQAWLARDFGQGEQHLRTAVELNSSLLDNGAGELARHFRSWTDLPKVSEPLEFLEGIYGHLPAELSGLAARKRSDLARAAVDFAHQFRAAGDLRRAGRCAWKAVGYRPTLLADRSLVSLLGRSILQKFKSEAATACD